MPREFTMPTTNAIVYGKDALGALPDVMARKGASRALVMMSGSLAGSRPSRNYESTSATPSPRYSPPHHSTYPARPYSLPPTSPDPATSTA